MCATDLNGERGRLSDAGAGDLYQLAHQRSGEPDNDEAPAEATRSRHVFPGYYVESR